MLTLSREEDKCKPLTGGGTRMSASARAAVAESLERTADLGRGLHSFTFRLNLSRFLHKTHPIKTPQTP